MEVIPILFRDFKTIGQQPKYLQLFLYIKEHIITGTLREKDLLPSTRELSTLLHLSRGTVTKAYEHLEDEGLITSLPQIGYVINSYTGDKQPIFHVDWSGYLTDKARIANQMDLMKTPYPWKKDMISFTSIAPNEYLFDYDAFRRSFLHIYQEEGKKLLNYGYAQGYRPLIDLLSNYMKNLGVDMKGKDILITNGFTEAFNIVLSTLTVPGNVILCENPTHHTSKKIMALHGIKTMGVPMEKDGIDVTTLSQSIRDHAPSFLYLTPSYHNPTGAVLSPRKRKEIVRICTDHQLPIIEDGFNEELRFNTSHCSPLISYMKTGNGVVYLSSFSKILFPGLRIGWIVADQNLIEQMVSYKRTMTIHTSFLDQGVLYQYMVEGHFQRYVKKSRSYYKEQSNYAISLLNKYLPQCHYYGDGALHLFVALPSGIKASDLLQRCYEKGVVFLLGEHFYTDDQGKDTIRLGISRVTPSQIEKGFQIIGSCLEELLCE